MDYTIRRLKGNQAEIEKIIEIDHQTFDECPYNASEFLERIDFETYPVYVAEIENEIVGFIAFMKVQTLHYSGLWIDLIGVKPAMEGKGIGKKLIGVGETLAKELGVDFRSALIKEGNISSIKAFESSGFEWGKEPFRLYFKENVK